VRRGKIDVMRFRLGMLAGAAIGYVLGARAGRERYEQIKRGSVRLGRHPAVRQLAGQATAVTDLARTGVAGGLRLGSEKLRDAADGTVTVQPSSGAV